MAEMKFLALVLLLGTYPLFAADPPEVIYHHGHVVTMWEAKPEVEAVAIRGSRIVAAGSNDEVLKTAASGTKRVDLRGRTMLPGIIESHVHPISAALSEKDGAVPVMQSIPEIQEYIRQQSAKLPANRLIFVPKIYSTRLKERRYPTRQELDAAAPERAAITHNGYASLLNSVVLKPHNITRDTPQPKNGKIIKDAKGEPTGLILGAPDLLGSLRATQAASDADRLWALRSMQKRYNQVGITSIIDRGQNAAGFRAYQQMHAAGELTLRANVTFLISGQGTPQEIRREIENIPLVTGWGDEWLRVGSLKTVVDGGILIGTAFLREPYGENTQIYGYVEPDYRGVLTVSKENVVEMARTANALGWQMTAHTTGGGAIDLLLDAYEATDKEKPILGRRFTVTHGNFPDARAIARAKKLGVAFDCQMAWHHLDGPALKNVFGPERMAYFLPLKALFDAGIVVAGGSDHMIRFDPRQAINPYHPFFGMWMAVTRKAADGSVINPEQRITREQALRMWTLNGAYLSFEEKEKGSIEPGKLADLIVVTKDYLTCPEDEIKDIEVLLTVVGGKTVHSSL
jgi:predicted amidohydrolase YtcJ